MKRSRCWFWPHMITALVVIGITSLSAVFAFTAGGTLAEPYSGGTGSISGFLWADGNGLLPTDWDGLYNGDESPLPGYAVLLYSADDLTTAIAAAQTDINGTYKFENLVPGNYVAGVFSDTVNGQEYLLPMAATVENRFAIDWDSDPLAAYTAIIALDESQAVEGINAGVRRSMGIAPATPYNINLSSPASVNGVDHSGTNLVFNSSAIGNDYTFTQSGATSIVTIYVQTGVTTTLTLKGINKNGIYIVLQGNANLTLLLAGTNTIAGGYITVPENAALTIDSAAGSGSEEGTLSVTGNSINFAAIGGFFNNNNNTRSPSGQITINGGTVNADRSASGTATQGAAIIGGGYGTAGNVTINGGYVTATVYNGGGAAIGGGFGAGGTGNVMITGGTVIAKTSDGYVSTTGAAIGGGMGQNGNVTISGGTVSARSSYGAAIGGGGRDSGNSPGGLGFVTISGGVTTAEADTGAGIGNGGAVGPAGSASDVLGKVTITGTATVRIYNSGGAGVGAGNNNNYRPAYEIDHTADITFIGRAQLSIPAGIVGAGANQGDGYFVNLYRWTALGEGMQGKAVYVFNADDMTLFRVIPVPSYINKFEQVSFSTGTTTQKNYKIYLDTDSGLMELIRLDNYLNTNPGAPIHGVNKMKGYRVHQYELSPGDYNDRDDLPVVWGIGYAPGPFWPVTEKHVDINGAAIPGIGDNITTIPHNSNYSKAVTPITDYNILGYKWDTAPNGSGSDISSGTPSRTITKAETIYFVYEVKKLTADVTISKMVEGIFGDRTKLFSFTVYFAATGGGPLPAGTTFAYESDVITDSGAVAQPNGALELETGGWDIFSLKHGQTITIKDIPADIKIQIKEAADSNYTAKIKDGGNEIGQNGDTGAVLVGDEGRIFAFVNERKSPPVVGVVAGTEGAGALLALALAALAGITAVMMIRRRKNGQIFRRSSG